MRCAIVIPAFNEEQALPSVLAAIPGELAALIVVADNGSSDQTASAARAGGAHVVTQPERGYGAACLKGIDFLDGMGRETGKHPPVLVILDGDHADDPALLVDFVMRIEREEADLVLSTRTQGGAQPGSMTRIQTWGNRLQTWAINRRFGEAALTDMGPMRAIRWSAYQRLGMTDRTWGWNVEMACKAFRVGLRVVEVPVKYRRRIGHSKISGTPSGVLMAGSKILWALARYAR